MTRLTWGDTGSRRYETGVDRGVLYAPGFPGVPWNGLVSVKENPSGGDPQPYYLDGIKYLQVAAAEEFEATIEALSAPDEFKACDGTATLYQGLYATQQPRKQFGFTYRTLIGNDVDGETYGYQIHIVYNALAKPASRSHDTLTNSSDAMDLSWDISTVPPAFTNVKPTAHLVVDTTKTDPSVIKRVENLLYGTDYAAPVLPTPKQLMDIYFNGVTNLFTNPSFESVSTAPQVTLATNLLTNPSFEATGAAVTVATNLITNPSMEAAGAAVTVRTNYIQVPQLSKAASSWGILNGSLTSSAGGGLYTCSSSVPGSIVFPNSSWMPATTPGETWIASYRVSVPADAVAVTLRVTNYFPGANAFVNDGAPVTINPGETKTVAGTAATAPANATYYRPTLATAVSMASGTRIVILDDPLAEKASVLGDFFDGSTPASGDFTYAWTGPVNASTSVQQAPSVTSYMSGLYSIPYQSQEWAQAGSRSVAIRANGAGLDSSINLGAMLSIIQPNKTYTFVGTIRLAAPQTTPHGDWARRLRINGNGTGVTMTPVTDAPNAAGVYEVRQVFTIGSGGAISMYLYNGSPVAGETVWWDNLALVEGTYLGPAFNGSTVSTDSDFTYAWTGTADASTSVQQGVYVASVNGGIGPTARLGIQSSAWSASGSKSLRIMPVNGQDGAGGASLGYPNMVAGKTYTVLATCHVPAVNPNPSLNSVASTIWVSGQTDHSPKPPNAPGDYALQTTFVWNGSSDIRLGGDTQDVWWDDVALVQGTYNGPAFNGDKPTDDFVYAWTGAANNSTSTMKTKSLVANVSGSNSTYVQSSDWASSGNKSLRIVPIASSNDSFATFSPKNSSWAAGTYTIIATIRLIAPQTGSLSSIARKIRIYHDGTFSDSQQPANVAGQTTLRLTFTITDATQYISLRLLNGASFGNGDVWWDNVTLVEGTYLGDAFNGDSPGAIWDGVPHASTSHLIGIYDD